ncbi:hypothetical protein [Arthrobacter sp. NPDC057009]|uniref:hypothetical protein n=1 Tax=Arthrobacter sp. NPDC057009 TaxID=3345996 RepID=UPI00363066B9
MTFAVESSPGPMVTDWIQTIATMVGILFTVLVAVGVSRREHERQVLHQSKKDVAEALTVLRTVMDEYFAVKTLTEISTEAADSDISGLDVPEIRAAADRTDEPLEKLESLSKLIQLTSPEQISQRMLSLVAEVSQFRFLISKTLNAHIRADLMARIGKPEALGPVTTAEEYAAQWKRITEAETLLTVVAMDYERYWGPGAKIRMSSLMLWWKFESWGRRKVDLLDGSK